MDRKAGGLIGFRHIPIFDWVSRDIPLLLLVTLPSDVEFFLTFLVLPFFLFCSTRTTARKVGTGSQVAPWQNPYSLFTWPASNHQGWEFGAIPEFYHSLMTRGTGPSNVQSLCLVGLCSTSPPSTGYFVSFTRTLKNVLCPRSSSLTFVLMLLISFVSPLEPWHKDGDLSSIVSIHRCECMRCSKSRGRRTQSSSGRGKWPSIAFRKEYGAL